MSGVVGDSKGCGKKVQVAERDGLGATDAFPARYHDSLYRGGREDNTDVLHLW